MVRFLLIISGPVDIGGIRYKNMGDRQFDQEFEIANWQVDLSQKLEEINKQYPEFKIYSFGRAFVYRYFYR